MTLKFCVVEYNVLLTIFCVCLCVYVDFFCPPIFDEA